MQEFPSLSIVIPSWNQGRFIERTLLSILRQDYPGTVQVIVSDGGSNDETVDVLKKYDGQIEWWSARDKGFVDAVTKGLARVTGEVVAIQSSDDYYLPGAFRRMAEAFQQYPEASFISGGEYGIDLQNNIEYANSFTGPITPRSILFEFVPAQHATFVRREALEKTGGMRVEVDMCADIDLWYRVAHFAPGRAIPAMLAAYQLHPDQRTATSPKWYPNLVKMVESCEQNPTYGSHFKLTDEERRNLYTYWEINWTAKRDAAAAKPIAWAKLPGLLSYSPRTRRMILGSTVNPLVKQLLPSSLVQTLRPQATPAAAGTSAPVDLNWWKNS
ncbi:glycosyltransferase [Hymenobacter sp. BT186]|uniref:Glycosyltransferase n=1 Tax=Hymenobacter telluris TaxID=2816474 RepID=A0A939J852_9BACT|nr:glycosyltransferase [Hymenobacter telluris]MBO0357384.1 glycosyltransferase [Hymenobacter telluris]MBW3373410.1 glycosyltransferase [Hymenobacter norwichensis]